MQLLCQALHRECGVEIDILCVRHDIESPLDEVCDDLHIYRVDSLENLTQRFDHMLDIHNRGGWFVGKAISGIKRILCFLKAHSIGFHNIGFPVWGWKFAAKLYGEKRYDAVITVSNRICTHLVWERARRHIRGDDRLKWIVYMLDPYADAQGIIIDKQELNHRIAIEETFFATADHIIVTPEVYQTTKYSPITRFSEKVTCFAQPCLRPLIPKNPVVRDDRWSECIYTGRLYPEFRNPEPLLQYFIRLPTTYRLHFYSVGCEELLKTYRDILQERLILHGYVQLHELEDAIQQADILINIGNHINNQVPSKVFDYISTGKPIAHFYTRADDSSKRYLDGYPYCFMQSCISIPADDDIQAFTNYFDEIIGKRLNFIEATNYIREHRLDSIVDQLYNIIK